MTIPRRLAATLKAAGVLGLALLCYWAFTRFSVCVDGAVVSLGPGSTVSSVLDSGLGASRGDLVSAVDGRVLVAGDGEAPRVTVNGVGAVEGTRLRPGDVVRTRRGADLTEPVIESTATLPAPTIVHGEGPGLVVAEEGKRGLERRVIGEVSGGLVERQVLVAAEPVVLKREPGLARAMLTKGKQTDPRRIVALTFDDGPWPGQTMKILQVLEEHDVPATFFMVGIYAERWPKVAEAVGDAGHAVGGHTQSHIPLTTLRGWRLYAEIAGGRNSVERLTDAKVRWFRPPGGKLDSATYKELRAQGLRAVLWSVDPQDWREEITAKGITDAVVAEVEPGAVVLLHDGGGDRSATIEALPMIIRRLRALGYEFVTMDEIPSPRNHW